MCVSRNILGGVLIKATYALSLSALSLSAWVGVGGYLMKVQVRVL